jgi:hypothetical protein
MEAYVELTSFMGLRKAAVSVGLLEYVSSLISWMEDMGFLKSENAVHEAAKKI